MRLLTAILLLIFIQQDFKAAQLKHHRVQLAYELKHNGVVANLKKHGLNVDHYQLYIRAFKEEGIIELWGKNKQQQSFHHFRTYTICSSSGLIGPKRIQGDGQVPEGYYHIDRFNPESSYHLSLGINYPNNSDKILSNKQRPGGHIFIHGDCVTIGCLPITDNEIKSLYIYCVEAIKNGQKTIPVTIFPMKLTNDNMQMLLQSNGSNTTKNLWHDLKLGYDYFNTKKQLPTIRFLANGRHEVGKQ